MIVKVIGMCNGHYKERTWADVEDYIFTNVREDLEDIVFTGNVNTPYSHVELIFADGATLGVSFSDRVYVMENTGRTIDLLKYDPTKENRYL